MRLLERYKNWVFVFVILIISYFTYFQNYWEPNKLFWDENYYIPAAEKYLQGVVYMQIHPPLGKMFIAFGEYIFNPNNRIDKSEFVSVDFIKDVPENYSFVGVRFFPVFFAFLSPLIFFLILFNISGRRFLSFLFSFLMLFDNAMIVNSRGAFFDSILIFFTLLTVYWFTFLIKIKRVSVFDSFLLGILVGLTGMIKFNGFVLFFLFFGLFSFLKKNFNFKIIIKKFLIFNLGIGLVIILVYYLHFSLGYRQIGGNKYNISDQYQEILNKGETKKISNFWIMFRDNLIYSKNYNQGIPKYNACKPDENGSLPYMWPFGNKAVNYRWEKNGDEVKYLYLQSNPICWFSALLGLILSTFLIAARIVFTLKIKDTKLYNYSLIFNLLYWIYMIGMVLVGRVLFLNSYFIPLLFSFILLFLTINYIFRIDIKTNNKKFYLWISIFFINVFIVYLFFSPLTYFSPITLEQFNLRQWFGFWKLVPVI